MLPTSQIEFSTDSSLISDVEQSLDRVYLPFLPSEAPLNTEIPETFELTTGNFVPLTSENVKIYVKNHLAQYVVNRGLTLKTDIDTFLQLFSLRLYSSQTLWYFLNVCNSSMLVGDTGLKQALGLVDGSEELNQQEIVLGTGFLYVRSFAVPIQAMRDILENWEEIDYFPDESAIWEGIISSQDAADALVYVRYVGQCTFPSTPEGRFAEDAASRTSGVLSHFLTSLASICPEAYQAAKVLVLQTTFGNVIADVLDDYERLLIGFLGYDSLLNRQQGGYYDNFEVIDEHKVIFTDLQTRIVERWTARRSDIPPSHQISSSLRTRVQDIQTWMRNNASIMHSIDEPHMQMLWTESIPKKYQGNVLVCLVGEDVTVEDFLKQHDFLDRLSNSGIKSRAAEKFIEAVQALVECEGHSLPQLQTESSFFNLFPFVDLIPWVGRPFLPTATEFLGRYLRIVEPIIVIGMGELVSNVLASNMIHTRGLPNGKYTQHVGIPRIISSASGDWITDDNVDKPDPRTLSILIPIFHPGMFKHHGPSRLPNTLFHVCMQVLFLHVSEAMTMLDEGIMLHPAARKQFLERLLTRSLAKMAQSGLQDVLDNARSDLQAEWQRQSAARFKKAPFGESFRVRRTDAAREVMEIAEQALGQPSGEERRRQLHRLWKKHLPVLHILHAHQEESREAWEVSMRQVPAGKFYATSLMTRHQNHLRQEAGKHPLEQILRQYAPATAQNDDWMWDEEQASAALSSHGRKMAAAAKRINPEKFSSENQRLRALARHGTDANFPVTLHGQRVSVKADGRVTVHWRDTELEKDETFNLTCRQAFQESDPLRTLQVTAEGIAILDENGRLIPIPRGKRINDCFLLKSEFSRRKDAETLRKAWVKSLELEGLVVPIEEPVAGGSTARIIPNRLKYELPVGVNDEVTPFKRFLDATFPLGGEVFFGQADRQQDFPAESQALMIWERLRQHLEAHSRTHPYFSFWNDIANGIGDNRKPIQHLKKLRPVTLERDKFSVVPGGQTSSRGSKQRIKGKLMRFGSPLPGAEVGVYRDA